MLQVDNLTTDLPTVSGYFRAIDGIGFGMRDGEVFALLGESGCGKSITALSVMRLLGPRARSTGRVVLDGEDLLELTESQMRAVRGARVAMVMQSPFTALNPAHRVGDQIAEAIRAHSDRTLTRPRSLLRGESRRSALWRDTVALLASVEVADPARAAERYPHEFSGGMCQRAVIAAALACSPRLLIADEPTTALDVTVQRDIVRLLDQVRRERGVGILLISHDFALVAEFADTAAVLYAGQVVERAPMERLLDHPLHPYTRALLQCVPDLDGRSALTPIPGAVPPRYDQIVGCRFAERCASRRGECGLDVPQLRQAEPGHHVRCILYD